MAITTLDGALAGFQQPIMFAKAATPTLAVGRPHSLFYLAGFPGAASAPTPGLSGESLTSYTGQIPFANPQGGLFAYLARYSIQTNIYGTVVLADRLWHNSGINITSTSPQTINSVTWPARDANGTTNGESVFVAVEVSTATGSGTPTLGMTYTNSDGTTGRSANNIIPTVATAPIGAFFLMGLQAGDRGVRSIQTFTLSATWTSGTIHLVAFRVLGTAEVGVSGNTINDVITGGFPRLYSNTVPFLFVIPNSTSAATIMGSVVYSHG